MKQFGKWVLALSILMGPFVLSGQICFTETFDEVTSIAIDSTLFIPQRQSGLPDTSGQWTTVGYYNFNIYNSQYYSWRGDGEAKGQYWGSNRQRIHSPSGGGAAVLSADSLNTLDSIKHYTAFLISPEITANSLGAPLFLSFYQYYRSFNSRATVEICRSFSACDQLNSTWEVIYDNDHIGRGTETANGEKIVVDLTPLVYVNNMFLPFKIRFHFEGEDYFWIIDDVTICEGQNPYGCTEPKALGEFLYPCHAYASDSLCNPYVPDQLLVEFKPGVPAATKDSLRNAVGVDAVDTCSCNTNLELWTFNIFPHDSVEMRSIDGITNTSLFEKKKTVTTNSNLQGGDSGASYNYYTTPEHLGTCPFPPDGNDTAPNLIFPPLGVKDRDTNAVVVAILDSGVDLFNAQLTERLQQNEAGGGCYAGDIVGHDFVHHGNNINDDNGHGTRTALLLVQSLPSLSCPFKILPLKTHDKTGVGTLFSNSCAMYYALHENAKVVSLSWGWRGEYSSIMQRPIDSLAQKNQAAVVVAAGNDTLNMLSARVYPAYFNNPNLVVVGSLHQINNTYEYSDFSNYSNTLVDISAPGEDIAFPGDTVLHSGTSYAAPPVAAVLAALYCLYPDSVSSIIGHLYECADKFTQLEPYVIDGRALSFDFPCVISPEVTGQLVYALTRDGALLAFDSKSPGIIRRHLRLSGVAPTQTLRGLDFRPASGELYALGYNPSTGQSRLYVINLSNGAANAVGNGPVTLPSGMGNIGMDFNPVTDRIRVTGSNNYNLRLNPVTGLLEATDTNQAFATGDAHTGTNPAVGTIAYNNSNPGANSTILYAYDDSLNVLIVQSLPNNGALHTVGNSGITVNLADPSSDLDIAIDPVSGVNNAYLAANTGTETVDNFYSINLLSGAATLIGKIGIGFAVNDIAVALSEAETACEVKVIGCMKYEILSITLDSAQNKTYKIRVTNNCPDALEYTAFRLPNGVTSPYPAHNSTYNSPGDHAYNVRNPSFSPFYSVRFKELGIGIAAGQADIFTFSLPPFSNPNYIYVTTQVVTGVNYATHLNVTGCTVASASITAPDETDERSGTTGTDEAFLFPNPTPGSLFLDLSAWAGEPLRIRILNSQGQQIQSLVLVAGAELQSFELPAGLSSGLYFFEIQTDSGKKQIEHFVLQR